MPVTPAPGTATPTQEAGLGEPEQQPEKPGQAGDDGGGDDGGGDGGDD